MRAVRLVATLAVVVLVATGCQAGTSSPGARLREVPAGSRGIVVDTDMGLDDALALLYLGSRPDVTIRAVTVEGDGLAHCGPGVRNARALLGVAGLTDIPVACGSRQPLRGTNAFPDEWRTSADRLYGLRLRAPSGNVTTLSATELLRQALDGETDLLTLGPFTNVARALSEDPALASRIPQVFSMAGALNVPGNAPNGVAEDNVWIDPLATSRVMAALPVTLVPLDATNAVPFTSFFVEGLSRHLSAPAARTVHRLVAGDPFLVSGQYYFWDPLAATLWTQPSLATYDARKVIVSTSGAAAGWISDDLRGSPVLVAAHVDALGFERAYLSGVAGGRVTDVRPRPDIVLAFDGDACRLSAPHPLVPGDAVLAVRNGSGMDATAVVAGFGGTTTYGDLLAFLGKPGSVVTGTPAGFHPLGTVVAPAGQDGWLTVTLSQPNVTAACGFPEGDAFRAWPAGSLPVTAGS